MTRNKPSFSNILFRCVALLSVMAMTGCVDDDLGYGPGVYPEGETTVSLEAAFSPFAESELNSRAALPGNAITDISDLVVLVYDKSGNHLSDISPVKIDFSQSEVKYEGRDDHDASNGHKAEAETKCLRDKKITLPYGEYYLIAVANLGTDYSGDPDNMTTGERDTYYELTNPGGKYYNQYGTLDQLRSLKVSWNSDYRLNRQMLGFFTNNTDHSKPDAPKATSEFKTVSIAQPGVSLRAWLRRCASKVTIDFDASGLRENVHVYVKSARIYDAPVECTLGFGNKSGDAEGDYNNHPGKDDDFISPDYTIDYGTGADYTQWPELTKGTPYILDETLLNAEGKPYKRKEFHTADKPALYFYENMQGDAPKGKLAIPDLVGGGVQNSTEKKDGVPYGTYVEVEAYYYAMSTGNISKGTIKYRFMLGKDVEKSCDAERNFHYKLTLKLRGNANEYDWHIDYVDDGFDIPNPWYISYLYNHTATMPFKYTPPKGYKVIQLTAKILENPWYPADGAIPDGEREAPYINNLNKQVGNGFLSLRYKDKTVVTLDEAGYPELQGGKFSYTDHVKGPILNNAYFLGEDPSSSKINRSTREYYFDGRPDETNKEDEAYSYTKEGDKYTFYIPLFTRAKVLVKQTGYSGNNPFVGYERHARLQITAKIQNINNPDDIQEKSEETKIIQVRRIVNPKGVYRKSGNNEDFDVTLLHLPGDNQPEFVEFKSNGPWMAEVVGDKNFITLDGRQYVTGSTNTPIKFKIKFNKLNPKSGNRNAVVRVRYHNYTCVHLIFVRQGYDAQAISKYGKNLNGDNQPATKWETCNQWLWSARGTDPRDEGSLFKYNAIGQGIDAYCNVYRDGSGDVIYTFPTEEDFRSVPDVCLAKGDGSWESSSWSAVTKDSYAWNKAGENRKIATVRDFEQLYRTPHIQFGYGVLYADGATTTQKKVSDAYGWYRRDIQNSKGEWVPDNKKGMRGMFAYFWNIKDPDNEYTAKNVFFPIGRSGYGHRKDAKGKDKAGTLRYASLRNGYADVFESVAPLFCHLYRRPGAIYYAKEPVLDHLQWDGSRGPIDSNDVEASKMYGLDINYFTFDVNAITGGNVGKGEDACFLRYVQ